MLTEFYSLTLMPNVFSYLYWQSLTTVSGKVKGVINCILSLISSKKMIWSLITEVTSLVKIIQVTSAMNANSESAFSALRRLKSYIHTTVLNNHLNHPMICTVHKELVRELNLKQVTNDFVDRVEGHSSIVGHKRK